MRWRRSRGTDGTTGSPPVPDGDTRDIRDVLAESVTAVNRASASDDPAALRSAVDALLSTLQRAPADYPYRGLCLGAAGDGLRFLFRMTGRRGDLDAAVECEERALAAIPRDDPQRPLLLNKLAECCRARFAEAGDLADLDAAVTWSREGLELAEPGGKQHTEALFGLGLTFHRRYHAVGGADARDAAIEWYERALTAEPTPAWDRATVLGHLEIAYRDRFAESGDREDLDRAADSCERALALPIAEPDHRRNLLIDLTAVHQQLFDLYGAPEDADASIRNAERVLAATETGDPSRPLILRLTAESYQRRFSTRGDAADLDACIAHGEEAATLLGPRDPDKARLLANLCVDHTERHRLTGDRADLDTAVERGRAALAATGPGHPDRPQILGQLAAAHGLRFARWGEPGDLDADIDLSEQALALAPADHRGIALTNLASTLARRYRLTGEPRDLNRCIEAGEEALADPGLNPEQRSVCFGTLSVAHRYRYEHFGAQADLDHAIDLGHRAVRSLGDDHVERASRLDSLASAYAAQFARSRERDDLDTAVELGEQALACSPLGPAQQALFRSNLAGHLLERFGADHDPADLEASIGYSRKALDGTASDDPDRPRTAAALAGALFHRHQRGTGPATDLDEAVSLIEWSVAASGGTHAPARLDLLNNLAVAYRERHERAGGAGIPADAVSRLVEAASRAAATATPVSRATGQLNIALLALSTGRLPEAARVFRSAVEALPECAVQGMAWSDQEEVLVGSQGLIGEATAAHLALGDVSGAVELAELGRGILLSQRLDARGDIAELTAAAPELAAEFEQLRAEADRRSYNRVHDLTGTAALRRSPLDTADRWNDLLRRIRELPGLAGFLAPPRAADLRRAAADGCVVLVNVSSLGGDAVLIRPDSLDRVPLPGLTAEDAQAHAHALAGLEPVPGHEGRKMTYLGSGGATPELLEWLWETTVEPVLAALGRLGPSVPGEPLPRVWWVPTGPLALLPLHAAGRRGGPSALDHVVSSYAPTVRALLHARQRPVAETRTQLAVTMRHTPGMPDLTGTAAEAARLLAGRPDAVALSDADATAAAVLDALPRASWAHFACHASGHPVKPSRNTLHLHDTRLPVPEISRLRLRSGELAYLSACSTGQGSVYQADEAIHLASAFQLAGYRHVVATLWPVNDTVAAMAARRFYRLLGDSPTADGAANALHEVTRRLRDRFPDAPDLWAPFVHSGP
ncbi:CHAT domain-containing protein [Streptomyces sp. HGB0020]|uniref:CHAT domain-containing protein n=1 Tax=Streptomyces sp. HGB0020 TaxID=1078086 RepID=UPI00034E5B36|nr:CHAT domain-containing protein [Streptomyces sp. HGB0020]EPD66102.1 hypothetical protein HMPREF1211_02123 [Streptomyces sp. HGB0020]